MNDRVIAPNSKPVDRMPGGWLLWVILGCLLVVTTFNFSFFGFYLSGWAWVVGLLAAGGVLLKREVRGMALPVHYWVPWGLLVLFYIGWRFENAVQSAAQILCPLVVGVAASKLRPSPEQLQGILKSLRICGMIFLGIIVFLRLPMLLLGFLPSITGLAPEAISAMLFQSLFLCSYLVHRRRVDLWLYLACALLPVVAITRGPILGSLALAALVIGPIGLPRRALIVVVALMAGWLVFQSERVQKKSFATGHGSLADVSLDSRNFRSYSRLQMWQRLWSGVKEEPWFGHGGNADAADLLKAGFVIYLPHNDWLRILFNYGILGCALYAGALLLQIFHGYRLAAIGPPDTQVIFYTALSAFVPYAVVMFTDNILIYASFYGNLHFLLLGLAYGSVAAEQEQEPEPLPQT